MFKNIAKTIRYTFFTGLLALGFNRCSKIGDGLVMSPEDSYTIEDNNQGDGDTVTQIDSSFADSLIAEKLHLKDSLEFLIDQYSSLAVDDSLAREDLKINILSLQNSIDSLKEITPDSLFKDTLPYYDTLFDTLIINQYDTLFDTLVIKKYESFDVTPPNILIEYSDIKVNSIVPFTANIHENQDLKSVTVNYSLIGGSKRIDSSLTPVFEKISSTQDLIAFSIDVIDYDSLKLEIIAQDVSDNSSTKKLESNINIDPNRLEDLLPTDRYSNINHDLSLTIDGKQVIVPVQCFNEINQGNIYLFFNNSVEDIPYERDDYLILPSNLSELNKSTLLNYLDSNIVVLPRIKSFNVDKDSLSPGDSIYTNYEVINPTDKVELLVNDQEGNDLYNAESSNPKSSFPYKLPEETTTESAYLTIEACNSEGCKSETKRIPIKYEILDTTVIDTTTPDTTVIDTTTIPDTNTVIDTLVGASVDSLITDLINQDYPSTAIQRNISEVDTLTYNVVTIENSVLYTIPNKGDFLLLLYEPDKEPSQQQLDVIQQKNYSVFSVGKVPKDKIQELETILDSSITNKQGFDYGL